MDLKTFFEALEALIAKEGLEPEAIYEVIETAFAKAYRREFGTDENVRVLIDPIKQEIKILATKIVEEDIIDEATEIEYADAVVLFPDAKIGDEVEVEIEFADFGRVAATTAKQVVTQKLIENRKEKIYQEFQISEHDIVEGVILGSDEEKVYVDLGAAETIMPLKEGIPGEEYIPNTKMKFYMIGLNNEERHLRIFITRKHSEFLKRLIEENCPEVQDGLVEIVKIAREVGQRAKVAVISHDENIEAIGAILGVEASRIAPVVKELNGEQIEVINYSEDAGTFIANALSPAKLIAMIPNEETKEAMAIVSEEQLSLAIGHRGQNARLVSRLTGWKVDIKSTTEAEEIGIPYEDFLI